MYLRNREAHHSQIVNVSGNDLTLEFHLDGSDSQVE
jgi:hypothetical protein